MTNAKWFTAAVLVVAAASAQAHTHLKEAVPAKDSTVKSSPENIMLTFSGPARVTVLTIQKEGEKEQKLSPLPAEAAAHVRVPAPKLSPGKYTVNWRVVGADSHPMSGKFSFTIDPAATTAGKSAPEQKHEHAR
jgi:methionine-rich copper-binding protein CopC